MSSAVDEVAAAVRARILEGELAPGSRLVERELTARHGVSRVTVRAALGALAAEGLVLVVPHQGARVAALDATSLRGLFELRTALEVEAVSLALARAPARLFRDAGATVRALGAVARVAEPSWQRVGAAHTAVHDALVASAGSARILAAHRTLGGELALFVVQLRATWDAERTAAHHEALLLDLEREGAAAIRRHLEEGERAVAAAL